MRQLGRGYIAAIVVAGALCAGLSGTAVFAGPERGSTVGATGSLRVVLCATKGAKPTSKQMSKTRNIVSLRATHGFGIKEPRVSLVGTACLGLHMPPRKNQSSVLKNLGRIGYLALANSGTTPLSPGATVRLACKRASCAPHVRVGKTNLRARPPVLQIVVPDKFVTRGSARFARDSGGHPSITYGLRPRGSQAWCTFTRTHMQRYAAIVLDNKVLADPIILSAICGSETQITGLTSMAQARRIAIYLNYGPLPVALRVTSITPLQRFAEKLAQGHPSRPRRDRPTPGPSYSQSALSAVQ